MTRGRSLVLAFVWALAASTPGLAACGDREARLRDLLAAGSFDAAEMALSDPGLRRDCTPRDIRSLRRRFAEALLGDERGAPEGRATAIERAAALHASWRVSTALGDLLAGRSDFVGAAVAYQEAINLLAASEDDEGAHLPAETLQKLARRAGEVRHLAASGDRGLFVPAPNDQRGGPGGTYNTAITRGIGAVRLPTPIQFEYNSTDFTEAGRAAAAELVTYLQNLAPPRVLVVGHTDRNGDDSVNFDLSKRRAVAVARFLEKAGVKAAVLTDGKGKTSPRILSDPSIYRQDQIDALDRRVEFELIP